MSNAERLTFLHERKEVPSEIWFLNIS